MEGVERVDPGREPLPLCLQAPEHGFHEQAVGEERLNPRGIERERVSRTRRELAHSVERRGRCAEVERATALQAGGHRDPAAAVPKFETVASDRPLGVVPTVADRNWAA